MTTVAIVAAALVTSFWLAVPLYLVSALAFGVYMPIKQGWINCPHPFERARHDHLARRALQRRRADRRPGRARVPVAGHLDPVRVAGRRPQPGGRRAASGEGAGRRGP